jgi:hypothetical protein
MSLFRKLVLVPIDETSTTTANRYRGNLPSYEDVQADEFNKMSTRTRKISAAPVITSSHKPSNELITTQIFSIPDKRARGQALSLLTRLQKNPFIEWDEMGNVHLYGNYLPRANIADLIMYAVYPKNPRDARKRATPPPHWNEFNAVAQRMSQTGSGYKQKKCPLHR